MGSYYIQTSTEQAVETIGAFAAAEGLGAMHVETRPDGTTTAIAAGTDWLGSRAAWTCRRRGTGTVVAMKPVPSRWLMTWFYPAIACVAVGIVCMGGMMLAMGLPAIGSGIFLLAMALSGVGMVTYLKLRFPTVCISLVALERRFAERLRSFAMETEQPPDVEGMSFLAQVLLLHVPFAILLAGLVRAAPLLGGPIVPIILGLVARAYATRAVNNLPRAAWRLLLTGWASARSLMCHPAFLAIAMFYAGHATMVLLQQEQVQTDTFIAAIQLKFFHWTVPAGANALASDAKALQHVVTRPDFLCPSWGRLDILVAVWWVMAVMCVIMLYWDFKGFWDWVRVWVRARPDGNPLPTLPSLRCGTWTRASKGLMFTWLVLVVLTNVIHALLTVETASVLLRGKAVFSQTMGEVIGWIVLDYRAAAEGSVHVSAFGAALAALLMLPTLLVLCTWLPTVTIGLTRRLRFSRSTASCPEVVKMVERLSSMLGIRCPQVRLVVDDRPCLETRIPWFAVQPTVLVSSGAVIIFSSAEMEAALAHELAHAKYDARMIRLTRWVSLLALFPCNVFAVMLDTESREIRADRTAVDLTGRKDPLVSAIVRASFGWIVGKTGKRPIVRFPRQEATTWWQKRWQSFKRHATVLAALCQPDLLLGYAHPHAEDRLRAIRQDG